MAINTLNALVNVLDRIDAQKAGTPVTGATIAHVVAYANQGDVLWARFCSQIAQRGTTGEKDATKSLTAVARQMLGERATDKDVQSARVGMSQKATGFTYIGRAGLPATPETFAVAMRVYRTTGDARQKAEDTLQKIADAPEGERLGMFRALSDETAAAKARAEKARIAKKAAEKAADEKAAAEKAGKGKSEEQGNATLTHAQKAAAWLATLGTLANQIGTGDETHLTFTRKEQDQIRALLDVIGGHVTADTVKKVPAAA